ncbi:MAG: S9 family peptidase [Gemmataceae bacterium]|nr:S9 family peptidase [Gemmataceae bacterium]
MAGLVPPFALLPEQLTGRALVPVGGYVLSPECEELVNNLRRRGVQVREVYEDLCVPLEAYVISKGSSSPSKSASAGPVIRREKRCIPAGSYHLPSRQPLGPWLASWLEPHSRHNLLGQLSLRSGDLPAAAECIIWRLPQPLPLWTGPPRLLPEERQPLRPITEALLFGPEGAVSYGFQGTPARIGEWLDAEHFLQVKDNKLWKVEARSGQAELFADSEQIARSLKALPKISPEVIQRWSTAVQFRFNPDRSGFLFDIGDELAVGYFDGRPAVQLTRSGGRKEYVTFSPDGRWVAFVRNGNLFAVELTTQKERQLTHDGHADVLNGKADWVYEEEVFQRHGQAYWWSPDSQQIAFLQFDDRPVRRFTITRFEGNYGGVEQYPYPKAGEANPLVRLGVVTLEGGQPRWLPLPADLYPPAQTLIVRVGWRPLPNQERNLPPVHHGDSQQPSGDGSKPVQDKDRSSARPDNPHHQRARYAPYAYVQNRTQTWLDLLVWDGLEQAPRRLLRETTAAWVDDVGAPHFLPDGSFLFLSERSGWKHLYHYAADGRCLRRVTHGSWDVQDVLRVEADQQRVYFTARLTSPTGVDFCRTRFDGPVELLSEKGKTHQISLAPGGKLYIDRFSDPYTPPQQVLVEIDRGPIRRLDTNPVRERERFRFGKHERVRIPLPDGFVLEGAITYPPGFDAKRRYPVWLFIYGGPRMPTIRDEYSAGRLLDQSLASSGIVVVRVDPRSASGKGAQSAWSCYKQLGVQELKDLEGAVQWLVNQGWADPQRMGLSGHSYGGYLTAYALTHSKVFCAGIASGPVTDWRLYDSIYTERYMLTPQENPEGYRRSSCVEAAQHLHGRLLIIHGMVDDNVHVQNSMQLAEALQKANKSFEMMVYPSARHGIRSQHYQRTQLEFIRRSLGVNP